MSGNPIGIFDSGIGGLTVASAVSAILPQEHILYFGDTAHLPYGDKSSKAILHYSQTIMRFLLENHCKCIVIACNSASASIGEKYKQWIPPTIPVLNVIDPVIQHLSERKELTFGLIGTKRTIQSGAFVKKGREVCPKKTIKSLATPLLAPMIEEGFYNNTISKTIIKNYLENHRLKGIESLILACTHYPLIAADISIVTHQRMSILNVSDIIALALKDRLTKDNLLNTQTDPPNYTFFVSDYTHAFEAAAKRFFGEKIKLKEISVHH
jgi:glutamate racemase